MPHFLLAMSILLALVGGLLASHQATSPSMDLDQVPGLQAHARAVLAWHAEAVSVKRASPTLTGVVVPTLPSHLSISFMSSCAGANNLVSWISDGAFVRTSEIARELRSQASPTDAIGKSTGTAMTTSAGATLTLPCPIPAGQIAIFSQL